MVILVVRVPVKAQYSAQIAATHRNTRSDATGRVR